MKKVKDIYHKLSYIFDKKDKRKVFGLLILIIIGSFLELLGVSVFTPFVNIIMNQDSIQKTWYLKAVFDGLGFDNNRSFLAVLSGAIILVYILKNVFLILQKKAVFSFSYDTQMKLSTRLLDTYMKEPYTFHLGKNTATLHRSIQEDTAYFMQVIMYMLELITEIVTCAVLGIFLLVVSKTITLVVIGLLVVCVFVFLFITKNYTRKLGEKNQYYRAKIFQWMNQALGGIKEIKILEREQFFVDTYKGNYAIYSKCMSINRLMAAMPKHIVEAVCMTGLLLAIMIKMFLGENDMTSYVPQLATFAVAALRLMPSVGKINEYTTNMLYAMPSVDLVYKDLTEIESYCEKIDAETVKDFRMQKGIHVDHVKYTYPDAEEAVITDAVLDVNKGETVAFIGASGAGKTTMVDIILGLLNPDSGHVLADDMDVHENPRTFHSQVGYIPQVIYLSDDTIRHNIAFGVPEEQIDDKAVAEAVKKAQLVDFIDDLPAGLETEVGDRGVRLSGGQRQRIGIARALYHDPEILVLDEATSALDNETETAVMEAIDALHGTKTMIIIAHRLTTIRNADRVYEVVSGNVVERDKNTIIEG